TDEPHGTLIFDVGSYGNGFGALGLPGTNSYGIPDVVIIRGNRTRVRSEHAGLQLEFQNTLIVTNSAYLQIQGDFHLSAATLLTLATAGRLEVTGTLTSELPLVVSSGATLSVGQSFTLDQMLTLTNGGTLVVSGAFTSSIPVEVRGGTLSVDRIQAPELVVADDGLLTCPPGYPHKLEVEVAGTLFVDVSSRIDVRGKGYLRGRTTGNTAVGGATGNSGGSYGGLGGSVGGTANAVYGDYADPDDWGSGGGAYQGGGLTRIRATSLRLDGQILANGLGESGGGGAGSGG